MSYSEYMPFYYTCYIYYIYTIYWYVNIYTHIHRVHYGGYIFQFPFSEEKMEMAWKLSQEIVELGPGPNPVWHWRSNSLTIKLYCLPMHGLFKSNRDVPDWLPPLREMRRYSRRGRKIIDAVEKHTGMMRGSVLSWKIRGGFLEEEVFEEKGWGANPGCAGVIGEGVPGWESSRGTGRRSLIETELQGPL